MPLAPAAPQETKADVHDNNTVLLEFDAVTDPDDTTKKIKDYKIVYTDQDPQADDAVWREMVLIIRVNYNFFSNLDLDSS